MAKCPSRTGEALERSSRSKSCRVSHPERHKRSLKQLRRDICICRQEIVSGMAPIVVALWTHVFSIVEGKNARGSSRILYILAIVSCHPRTNGSPLRELVGSIKPADLDPLHEPKHGSPLAPRRSTRSPHAPPYVSPSCSPADPMPFL